MALVAAVAVIVATSGPASARSSRSGSSSRTTSQVTAITPDPRSPQPFGSFDGVQYERIFGTVTGTVDPAEPVAVQAGPPLPATYTAEFELITPASDQPQNTTVVVEAENRGGPVLFYTMNGFQGGAPQGATPVGITYPDPGNGYLFDQHISYARVQWQTGFAAGVPENAQGVGEVVVRDFARQLLGRGSSASFGNGISSFRHGALIGWSQSAWFIDTFIAEGFNVDPATGRRVFDAAFTKDGAGNWLAINQLNQRRGDPTQTPYVQPDGVPLTYDRLLTRPKTDPLLVDSVAYTDYYRVRASISGQGKIPSTVHRYDFAMAHASAALLNGNTGILVAFGCSPIPPELNSIDGMPYEKTILAKLLAIAGGHRSVTLPPSRRFRLGGTPPDPPAFNPLPGHKVEIPAVDARTQPRGGVRIPEVRYPLAELTPPSIPPVSTESVDAVCGNFGGAATFPAARLAETYGNAEKYAARYARALTPLVRAGYLNRSATADMVAKARTAYETATTPAA